MQDGLRLPLTEANETGRAGMECITCVVKEVVELTGAEGIGNGRDCRHGRRPDDAPSGIDRRVVHRSSR